MRRVKHFINDRQTIVNEAIDAYVALSDDTLRRLEGYPAIKVVLRADWDRSQVAVVSGGGSGHEPAHAGFVGEGMLTAAVCGEIFASPSVDAVLAAILAVTGEAGCLLIVKNYTGDRLNFGLAAEKARSLGLNVEMVIVGDDVALPDATRPRGIAGTLFVHKVAGHVARSGASLAEVKAAAALVARTTVSIGVSLTTCTIPGQPAQERLGPQDAELGLGIHGEPGVEVIPLRPVRELASMMMKKIEDALDLRLAGTAPLALLINDLGGVPPIELAIIARSVIEATHRHIGIVFGPTRLMTSLDMRGFSVSALPLPPDPSIENALLSPVGPRAWPLGRRPRPVAPIALHDALRPREHRPSEDAARRKVLDRICRVLVEKEAELNALDARVGDGDTGTTLATAARALFAELDRLPFASPSALCLSISDRLSRVMGGSSGILLAIFTAAMGAKVGDPPDWHAALAEGLRRMQEYGGAIAGDRTMVDALGPAIAALQMNEGVSGAARAAAEGGARTAEMIRARAGRSTYVREDALRGVPDPGAVAVAAVFAALAERSETPATT